MTQTERNRFTILVIILIVLVVAGIGIAQFRRRSEVGADILGVIQNQAVATYTDPDGIPMQQSLSDISQLTVSGGVGTVKFSYSLGKQENQNAIFDIQFYRPSEDEALTIFNDKKGESGFISAKLNNIPNGAYDIALKPVGYLSQVLSSYNYSNGKVNAADVKDPFLWGDIDISHNDKGDDKVNSADWAILVKHWNTDNAKADYNGDGKINSLDAAVLLGNWNKQGTRFDTNQVNEAAAVAPEL